MPEALEPRAAPSDSLVGLIAIVEGLQAPGVGLASCLSEAMETSEVLKTSEVSEGSSFVDHFISGGSDPAVDSPVGRVANPSYAAESPSSPLLDSVDAAVALPHPGDADSPLGQLDVALAGLLALRSDAPSPGASVVAPPDPVLTDAAFGSMASVGTAGAGGMASLASPCLPGDVPSLPGGALAATGGRASSPSYDAPLPGPSPDVPPPRPHGEIRPVRFARSDDAGRLAAMSPEGASTEDGSPGDAILLLTDSGGSGAPPIVDLDIAGIGDGDEQLPGGLVVKNSGGNDAPRKRIDIQPQQPDGWEGFLLLTRNVQNVRVFTAPSGGSEVTFNGTDNVFASSWEVRTLYVQGAIGSSSMRDVTLTLTAQGYSGGSGGSDAVKFTVLWVDPVDVASSPSKDAANDNDKRDNYKDYTVADTYALGPQLYEEEIAGLRMGWGIEVRGNVQPANFSYPGANLRLEKDLQFHDWIGNGDSTISEEPFSDHIPEGNDVQPPDLRDDNPTDSDPQGAIYELDAPGLDVLNKPVNEIRRTRDNFRAFASATVDGSRFRCSFVTEFYVRFSMKQTAAPTGDTWVVIDPPDVAGDKNVGSGTTPLTWNLQ